MNDKEKALLEAIGMNPKPSRAPRVLIRRPLTIVFDRHWSIVSWIVGLTVAAISCRHGAVDAVAAGAVAGLALTLSVIAHEGGHLLAGRGVRGVTPRMLVVRAGGGVSVVEGRFRGPRGAARFAVGGPLASLALGLAYVTVALTVPIGVFSTALLVPAAIIFVLLVLNMLPLAPMDGYMIFRSLLWAGLGDREEAERRAIGWSRTVLAYGLLVSAMVLVHNQGYGVIALSLLATCAVQHHMAFKQFAQARSGGGRPPDRA
jgi:Zn-dependent protease